MVKACNAWLKLEVRVLHIISLIGIILLIFSGVSFGGTKANGERCITDSQCASGECRNFKCIAFDENAMPTGNTEIEKQLNKLDKIIPILNDAGFVITRLIVEVTLIPVVSVYLKQVHQLNKTQQRTLLTKNKDNPILTSILKSLFTIYSFNFSKYDLNESIIQLNPPKATIFLDRK
jgi:hypothetical protein